MSAQVESVAASATGLGVDDLRRLASEYDGDAAVTAARDQLERLATREATTAATPETTVLPDQSVTSAVVTAPDTHVPPAAVDNADDGALPIGPIAVAGAALLAGAAIVGVRAARKRSEPDISRRQFMGGAAAALAGGTLYSRAPRAALPQATETEGFNVLAIVIDDLNDYPTFMGGSPMPVHTPNLDALAAESRVYMNHHVAVPICPPSRATLMWGRNVAAHGVSDRGPLTQLEPDTYQAFAAAHENESLPALASAAGIATYGGGKLFHGNQYAELWTSFVTNRSATGDRAGPYGTFFDMGTPIDDRRPDDELRDFALDVLRTHDPAQRFLLMPGIRHPHLPWRVDQKYFDLYPIEDVVLPESPENDWDDLGPIATAQLEQVIDLFGEGWFDIVQKSERRAEHMQGYLAAMSHADSVVGDILNGLASSRFADDTVVMLVSDNGYHQGENFAYRKLTLRNQATRTPFMIRGPAGSGFTSGIVDDAVSSVHFAATILDTLGVDSDVPTDGQSLRYDAHPPAVVTTHAYNSASVVWGDDSKTGGRWTFHFDQDAVFDPQSIDLSGVAEMELYDHATDPNEFDNLLAGWLPPS